MKVLIAGGAGFIGSTIASACLDAGITPVILDNLATGRAEFTKDRIFYPGDIADGDLLDKIFAEHPDLDAVVHAAALIVVPESVAQPLRYYRDNVAKSIDFIDHVLRNGCTRYLFSSSAAIYGPGEDFAVDEASPLAPSSPYARSKVMMEQVLEDTSAATPLRVLSLRYFNPIGADPELRSGLQVRYPTHLLGKLLTAVENDEEFLLTGVDWPTRDGSGIRDFIHVWDLARAHVEALRRFDEVLPGEGGQYLVINVGTGNGTTVREFVAAFRAATGAPLMVRETGPRPGDVAGSFTRSTRAARLLGWSPELSIEDAIRDSVRWSAVREERLTA
ncbi:MAG TPA: UDP-glucose 4-epimerase GalE [Micromonosporaceae bacterium]